MFKEVRESSFADIFSQTQLILKDLRVFGYSSPFTLNIFINTNDLNKYDWPENAVRGLLAHELAHQVSYKRRTFLARMLFVWNYPFSFSRRMKVEREADEIAIERGYGNDLVQERTYQFRIEDKKRLEAEKKVYLSPESLSRMVDSPRN